MGKILNDENEEEWRNDGSFSLQCAKKWADEMRVPRIPGEICAKTRKMQFNIRDLQHTSTEYTYTHIYIYIQINNEDIRGKRVEKYW